MHVGDGGKPSFNDEKAKAKMTPTRIKQTRNKKWWLKASRCLLVTDVTEV